MDGDTRVALPQPAVDQRTASEHTPAATAHAAVS